MASEIKGEIEMNLAQANATIRAQNAEIKKLRTELKGTQVDADKAGDSLNKQARRARSDLAVFGAQGRLIGQAAQGLTSLVGPIGVVGGAVMGVSYAWEKLDEHMRSVIARGVEMKMMNYDIAKSIHEDQAKIGENIIKGTPEKTRVSNLLSGIKPETFINEMREKYGISKEDALQIVEAIGPSAQRKKVAKASKYIEDAYAVADIARVAGGVSIKAISSSLVKIPSISDVYDKARQIIKEETGVPMTKAQTKEKYEKGLADKAIQAEASANIAAVKIEKGALTPGNISKALTAKQEEQLLQNYRDFFSGAKDIESKIREQKRKTAASKAEMLGRRKLEMEVAEKAETKEFSGYGSWENYKEAFWLGYTDIVEFFSKTPAQKFQKQKEFEEEVLTETKGVSGMNEEQWNEFIRLIRSTSESTKETATAITTEMKR